jgi:mannose-1-phosphate guanylyltransferase/mannose-6-phosphate isomerase
MITVIIAGGSGTRLWPLSTPDYPKHLLRVNGHDDSLVQATYHRVKSFSSKVFVITEAGHAHHVRQQLPELEDDHFIIEPARRGTANCIVAGLVQIHELIDADEPIAFVAADHYVRDQDGYRHSFEIAELVSKRDKKIVLVGVEPDHPSTGFGYIAKGSIADATKFVYNVDAFKEKPNYETARQYIKSGNYLWNCGYFVGSLNTFLAKMQAFAPVLRDNYNALLSTSTKEDYTKIYLELENTAIDYALIEKVEDLLVVPATFDWMDLGSFIDLHRAAMCDEQGNYFNGRIESTDTSNSFVDNKTNKVVAVVGLDNVVVINTPEGVLVARKDMSQEVGEIAKRIQKK